LAGRCAGRGYSLVLIGISFGIATPEVAADLVNRAFANPNHVVSPPQVK